MISFIVKLFYYNSCMIQIYVFRWRYVCSYAKLNLNLLTNILVSFIIVNYNTASCVMSSLYVCVRVCVCVVLFISHSTAF